MPRIWVKHWQPLIKTVYFFFLNIHIMSCGTKITTHTTSIYNMLPLHFISSHSSSIIWSILSPLSNLSPSNFLSNLPLLLPYVIVLNILTDSHLSYVLLSSMHFSNIFFTPDMYSCHIFILHYIHLPNTNTALIFYLSWSNKQVSYPHTAGPFMQAPCTGWKFAHSTEHSLYL